MFLNHDDILETLKMIRDEKLDIRTITMGISLRDCSDEDPVKACSRIYDKITRLASRLVKTGEEIEAHYGIPIIHKRISVTPIALVAEASLIDHYGCFAETLDRAAQEVGVNFIGGFSALVQKGMTRGDEIYLKSLAESLAATRLVCGSVNIATTQAGINMNAVREIGTIIKNLAYLTRHEESIGCAKLVIFANAPEDNPFMAGAFHGPGEGEAVINVGISGPGVIKSSIDKLKGADLEAVSETIKRTAFKITRVGQLVAREASRMLGIPFGIVDLSLAPTPSVGDSVAHILEEIGLEKAGCPGTTAALMLLNDAVKKGGTMASSFVGGLSGAFIPVSEDLGMIDAVEKGSLTIEKLEAMTAVCSVGLDMIAVPGDISPETISAVIADEAAIGVVNHKTTAVRIIPVFGKKEGDSVHFGGLLGHSPVMKINRMSPEIMINRGGRIPAPIHSFKN